MKRIVCFIDDRGVHRLLLCWLDSTGTVNTAPVPTTMHALEKELGPGFIAAYRAASDTEMLLFNSLLGMLLKERLEFATPKNADKN